MFYVYTLKDPRTCEVFYVGKGTGKRAYQHVAYAQRGKIGNLAKHNRIIDILSAGHEVEVEIVEHFECEEDAVEAERIMIEDGGSTLTNIQKCGVAVSQKARRAAARRKAVKMFARMKPYFEWVREKKRPQWEIECGRASYHGVISIILRPEMAAKELIFKDNKFVEYRW